MWLKKRITLRVSILTVYAVTFIILMSTFILAGSLNFRQAMARVAEDLMTDTSNLVLQELELKISPARTMLKLTELLMKQGIVTEDDIVDYSVSVAKSFPQVNIEGSVRMAGWGDAEGNSIATFQEDNGSITTKIIKLNTDPPLHYDLVRDLSGKVTKKELPPVTYDPRERPWFITAVKAKDDIWTDIFIPYPYKNPSIAAAAPIYKKSGELLGVYEIEIKLITLSDFLDTLRIGKSGVAFIVNAKDELVAYPGMKKWLGQEDVTLEHKLKELREADNPQLKQALLEHQKNELDRFSFIYEGVTYLASFHHIDDFKQYGWKVGVVVPESDFIGLLKRKNFIIVFIGLGILVLGIISAMIFSKRMAQSMSALVDETARIKNFQLEGAKIGTSVIKEVDVLADAIYSMKKNLRAFQKYLPASLVRLLIQSGEEAQIGGAKKVLTIFFSDIQGFTAITETLPPETIMQQLCDYFDSLTKIITETNGTIDKFIGDSIMAFWGAPIPDADHCAEACHAALRCKRRIDEMNAKWSQEGKPLFITRIGIHTGEVIVGNIGSSERINYTVVGDSVNFASRLEQMNKIYHTAIIVSHEVFLQVGDRFEFRLLDNIEVKGKTGQYKVYELLNEK